jgi:hypothetical protein
MATNNPRSSNGRTESSGLSNLGSSPSLGTNSYYLARDSNRGTVMFLPRLL